MYGFMLTKSVRVTILNCCFVDMGQVIQVVISI